MKLWLKISMIAIIMVTLATCVCSLLMLLRSGRNSLDIAVQNTLTEQQVRAASWSETMVNELDAGYSAVAQRSLARYLIDKFADEKTILISGDDFIFNTTSMDPRQYLPTAGDEQQYIIEDIDGSTWLIAGKNIKIKETAYALYSLKDISAVYKDTQVLAFQFSFINLAVMLGAGAAIIVLVRFVLRPIAALKRSAGLIAAGIYDKRIEAAQNDEVGELAAHFNTMAEAVESRVAALRAEADRRTMFMSALTHELKTPITAISGNAQTLLRTKMDDDEREDALMCIDSECTRIERLSQKLMQLILLQNGGIHLEQIKVEELLDGVRQSCAEQIKQRGLRLSVTNDMDTLLMEKDLMISLLLNLIDNAGKASHAGGLIELSVSGNAISVRDYGKGIARDDIDKVAQPFYMVDKSRSKKAGGIGLGLALADEIAQLHGAKLVFESTVGKGTTVKVVFENV